MLNCLPLRIASFILVRLFSDSSLYPATHSLPKLSTSALSMPCVVSTACFWLACKNSFNWLSVTVMVFVLPLLETAVKSYLSPLGLTVIRCFPVSNLATPSFKVNSLAFAGMLLLKSPKTFLISLVLAVFKSMP